MAKLKKNATLEEKLEYYNEAISKAESELKELKTMKKVLNRKLKIKNLQIYRTL